MNNIPAFPFYDTKNNLTYLGMTLLDYLAGEIAQGYLASMIPGPLNENDLKHVAETSYKGAAEMIEARKKYI